MAQTPYELRNGENEIIEGYANKIGFWGGGGGKLVLTSQRLMFTNRRKSQIKMEIDLRDVIHVDVTSSATIWSIALLVTLLMKNAIRVTRKGGNAQRFVVTNKDRWADLINEYRRKTQVQHLKD